MCTVTFIPVRDKLFITSNRDEKLCRRSAIAPALYRNEGQALIFPKDAEAGGTWIAMRENSSAAVLLNGAFIPHLPQSSYRMSRGQVFLDILAADRPSYLSTKIDLHDIAPFTMLLLERNSLYEFRWDGEERYCKQLSVHRPHIWSSVTLYDGLITKKREQWFAEFMDRCPGPTQQDIINFHRFTGDGDRENDLIMSRDNICSTVSITSMLLTADRGSMKYIDLKVNSIGEKKIEFITESETV